MNRFDRRFFLQASMAGLVSLSPLAQRQFLQAEEKPILPVAYASIRMEATYMVMGESAGIAAVLALEQTTTVQDLDRNELTARLKKHGQILAWDGEQRRYGTLYSSNVFDPQRELTTRWQTHPDEYSRYPVQELYRHGSPRP
ncbi:MAG TPA: FAD-dependent oxidoreductase [Planctomicrobium sp.]|nr:FAD-dependent oxidoreductase [Planctomicrobium sp.]